MLRKNWSKRLDRLIADYKRGYYTARELEAAAVALMPCEAAGEIAERLPDEVAKALRKRVSDASSWTDDDWASTITIDGPPATEESRAAQREKYAALNAYFALADRKSESS